MGLKQSRPEAPTEGLEIDLLLAGVAAQHGYDFRGYSRPFVRRRVKQAMLQEGVSTVSALQERVLRDAGCLTRFVETVAVERGSMFGNPEMYLVLRREVIPWLRTYPFVAIWMAGCSTGEELYATAITFYEEGLLDRCRLYATDVSDAVVEHARQGIFPLSAASDFAAAYERAGGRRPFETYCRLKEEGVVIEPFLRSKMIFSRHNLVCDAAFNEFQLILCRNVVSHLDPPLRDRVQEILHASLQRSGVLALGTNESLRGTAHEESYRELGSGVGLFRRLR